MKKQEFNHTDKFNDSTSDESDTSKLSDESYDFISWVDEYVKDEPVE